MELEELSGIFSNLGFLATNATSLPKDFDKLIKSVDNCFERYPITNESLNALAAHTTCECDLIISLFPIPTEISFQEDFTETSLQKSKSTFINLHNLKTFVDTSSLKKSSIYNLAPAFVRVNYYNYIIKLLKKIVTAIEAKNHINIKKCHRRLFSNSPLPEKFLTLLCNLATVGKNNLILPHAQTSSVIICGLILPRGTISKNGKPLPLVDKNFLADPNATINLPKGIKCKGCSLCQSNCPANAFSPNGNFIKERCFQFSSHSSLPYPDLAAKLKVPLFYGCSSCQIVCPHYKRTKLALENRRRAIESGIVTLPRDLTVEELLSLSQEEALSLLKEKLKGSALDQSWIDLSALLRNINMIFKS